MELACGIAEMLKQDVENHAIINRKGNSEVKGIYRSLTKLRTSVHHLEIGHAIKDLRLALQDTLLVVCKFVGISAYALSEISQQALPENVRCKLQKRRGKEAVW